MLGIKTDEDTLLQASTSLAELDPAEYPSRVYFSFTCIMINLDQCLISFLCNAVTSLND